MVINWILSSGGFCLNHYWTIFVTKLSITKNKTRILLSFDFSIKNMGFEHKRIQKKVFFSILRRPERETYLWNGHLLILFTWSCNGSINSTFNLSCQGMWCFSFDFCCFVLRLNYWLPKSKQASTFWISDLTNFWNTKVWFQYELSVIGASSLWFF